MWVVITPFPKICAKWSIFADPVTYIQLTLFFRCRWAPSLWIGMDGWGVTLSQCSSEQKGWRRLCKHYCRSSDRPFSSMWGGRLSCRRRVPVIQRRDSVVLGASLCCLAKTFPEDGRQGEPGMAVLFDVGYLPELKEQECIPVSCLHNLSIFCVHKLTNIAYNGLTNCQQRLQCQSCS